MVEVRRVRVKGHIPGYPPGSVVKIRVDEEGTPLDRLWRRRLKDAKTDGCCELVEESGAAEWSEES